MRTFRLEREQLIPLGIRTAFSFFAEARNLEHLTPPWLRFEILSRAGDTLEASSLIDYRLRLHGVPVRWRSQITIWEPPCRFVDAQRAGPYRVWVHTHSFHPRPRGTLVRDEVLYSLPGGDLLGPMLNRFFVRPDLERIFDYRRERLQEWAEGQRGKGHK